MKKFLAIIFLTIFSFQLLPVKAIGKMLWDNQMTEEVQDHVPLQKKMNTSDHDRFWYLDFSESKTLAQNAPSYLHALRDEALIKCLHLEVLLQPPNLR